MAGVRTIGPKRAWNREALLEMGAALSADRRRSRRRAGKISGGAGDSTTERGSEPAITGKGRILLQGILLQGVRLLEKRYGLFNGRVPDPPPYRPEESGLLREGGQISAPQ